MSWPRKPYIDRLVPYEPGRPIEEVRRALGLGRLDKLASNENPLGVSPRAARALRRFISRLHFYPESKGPVLLRALAARLGVKTDQVVLGNGSNEIIELLCRGFVSRGDEVVSSDRTFLVYPLVTQTCGGRFRRVPMKDFRYDLTALGRALTSKTRLIFIANPNNPTGTYVRRNELDAFVRRVPKKVVVCIDEAYVDFVAARDYASALRYVKKGMQNVIVLRTFSKSYGLAGLRIGYGVGHRRLIEYLNKIRQPFNVNAAAQTAALAALSDRGYLRKTQRVTQNGRAYLYEALDALGLRYVPSQANFVLIDLGRPAAPVVKQLLRKGIIVRGMDAYRLNRHIRVSIGRPGQNKRFIKALEKVL